MSVVLPRNTFFSGDHHFGHEKIIEYCSRPFDDVKQMDDELVDRWNSVVSDGDNVVYVGDFSLSGDEKYVEQLFSRLNGLILYVCVPWHHDRRWIDHVSAMRTSSGRYVYPLPSIEIVYVVGVMGGNGKPMPITVSHYPMLEWEASHYGAWHVHGHSHGNSPVLAGKRSVDVGVDANGYMPMSIEEIEYYFDYELGEDS